VWSVGFTEIDTVQSRDFGVVLRGDSAGGGFDIANVMCGYLCRRQRILNRLSDGVRTDTRQDGNALQRRIHVLIVCLIGTFQHHRARAFARHPAIRITVKTQRDAARVQWVLRPSHIDIFHPGGEINRMIDSAVIDLPQPDSPTRPSNSPRSK
jgi:hypothetical protein